MGKLDGKVAVITAGSSGMALATAKLFVEEGAYVFISGRDQDKLDQAVKEIGRNVTGVQADSSKVADLERLFEQVKGKKGQVDVLFASAGHGGPTPLAVELKDRKIRTNVLSPGPIDPPLMQAAPSNRASALSPWYRKACC